MEQVSKDTDFLRSINTNDYSLLLGIQSSDFEEKHNKNGYSVVNKKERVFLGIIDTLTNFGVLKKFEYGFKFIAHGDQVSCLPPDDYQNRFLEFLQKIL
jgi:hypothetical protein